MGENHIPSYVPNNNSRNAFCLIKKHLFLNLQDKNEKQKVYDLIVSADIVITNFKPGDDAKLGMDYNTLKKYNSSLIYGVYLSDSMEGSQVHMYA